MILVGILWLYIPLYAVNETDSTSHPVFQKRTYVAQRLPGEEPSIDGRLDDACWQEGEWSEPYVQFMPKEGGPPSQETNLKIFHDDRNVYVAIRAHETEMDKIHRYAGRRDEFNGDVVGVCFDSYFDKRTGFEFDITAAGTKIDLILMNDASGDKDWNAVWDGEVAFEDSAWTAEMRIPLNQLRYGDKKEQVWGMHSWRWIDRNQEEDQWNLIPRNNKGYIYSIGELHGIRDIKPKRHIELLPYLLAKSESMRHEPGDPFADDSPRSASAGLDAKIGVTSDFTLDMTVNPDFGQVEADPSVMNLTAFETFYSEKRPFFLEGKNILSFSGHGQDALFYSRRIGHQPSRAPDPANGEFVRMPENTSILSAAKLTGKTKDGLSLGVLGSLTGRETAEINNGQSMRKEAVEPLSQYWVGRIQKDFRKGNTILGGMATASHRYIRDDGLKGLPSGAYTAGMDFLKYFKDRLYYLDVKAIFSRVEGAPKAIAELQTNAVHRFQRPGASHLSLDSTRTELMGHGGQIKVGRGGSSKWRFYETVYWYSPGLDLNDLGYLMQADLVHNEASVSFNQSDPQGLFRWYSIGLWDEASWDFSGLRTDNTASLSFEGQFKNKWGMSIWQNMVFEPVDTRLLRGGPAIRLSRFHCSSTYFHTDESKPFHAHVGIHNHIFPRAGSGLNQITPGFSVRPVNAVIFGVEMDYSLNKDNLQYVATAADVGQENRYILGKLNQKTFGLTLKLEYFISPNLSIQYSGSPFMSMGEYSDFKKVTNPTASRYEDRFRRFESSEIGFDPADNVYRVSETAGQAYYFDNPDFSFRQFRSNLVIRWEYRPGSVAYLVWSQQRTSYENRFAPSIERNWNNLFDAFSEQVFLVKLSHWFSI